MSSTNVKIGNYIAIFRIIFSPRKINNWRPLLFIYGCGDTGRSRRFEGKKKKKKKRFQFCKKARRACVPENKNVRIKCRRGGDLRR